MSYGHVHCYTSNGASHIVIKAMKEAESYQDLQSLLLTHHVSLDM